MEIGRDISGSKSSINKGRVVLASVGPYGEQLEVQFVWSGGVKRNPGIGWHEEKAGCWSWELYGIWGYLSRSPAHLHDGSPLNVFRMVRLFLNKEVHQQLAISQENPHYWKTILIIRRIYHVDVKFDFQNFVSIDPPFSFLRLTEKVSTCENLSAWYQAEEFELNSLRASYPETASGLLSFTQASATPEAFWVEGCSFLRKIDITAVQERKPSWGGQVGGKEDSAEGEVESSLEWMLTSSYSANCRAVFGILFSHLKSWGS